MPWTTMAGMAGMNLGSSVIGGALNGLMNMGFQEFAAKRQHERDLESMDHQADLNRAQYDYERMMESPTRIAQQYEQAGMNPALAMSSGATSPGMTASVSPSSAISNPASSPFKGSSISLPSIAELQRVDAQNKLDVERANYEREAARKASLEADFLEWKRDNDYWTQELRSVTANAESLEARAVVDNLEKTYRELQSLRNEEFLEADLKERKAKALSAEKTTEQLVQTIENLKKDGLIKDELYSKAIQETRTAKGQADAASKLVEKENALIAEIQKRTDLEQAKIDNLIHDVYQGYISVGIDAARVVAYIAGLKKFSPTRAGAASVDKGVQKFTRDATGRYHDARGRYMPK